MENLSNVTEEMVVHDKVISNSDNSLQSMFEITIMGYLIVSVVMVIFYIIGASLILLMA